MLELDIIKQHVRLEPDFEEDDTLLDTYSNAARRLVENRTGRKLYATAAEIPKDGDGNATDEKALVLDDDLVTAMLLLIGGWYENRESITTGTIVTQTPLAFEALISPYRFFHF